jgi:queuine tRNA-ribosyltransferase
MAECKKIQLNHGEVPLPAFFPDGTYGSVRCVDKDDLMACGVAGIVMNGYHLLSKPGLGVIRHFGGARRFSGWDGPIITDSGGFQIFSLLRENGKFGEVRKNGLILRAENGEKLTFTPEKCIQTQFACDSDIMMCLDCCTHPDDSYETSRNAVDLSVEWAIKCKSEYELQMSVRGIPDDKRPLLFAIIQGGGYRELREYCAGALIEIGFDGYGFGGWPVTADGRLTEDILEYTASLMPDGAVKYAMGIGKPGGLIKCARMGYDLFDCVIPTRDARHNRLYILGDELDFSVYYALDDIYIRDERPISPMCGCSACKNYSRAYIHHLIKVGDPLAQRLATMHNLRFYSDLTKKIREKINGGTFYE